MLDDLLYVYCLLNSPPELWRNKQEGLKSFMFNNFYVVFKYVSESEFSEENFKKKLSDINWLEFNAREHIRIITEIMAYSTVVPFKFGTIYNSEAGLKKFITDYSDSLIENFQLIGGKEEWSVKIYCDRKTLCTQIDELSDEAAKMEQQIMASSPGKAFLLKRKKTELIESEMDRLSKKYGQQYYEGFQKLGVLANLNNLLPKEFTGRGDTMILNATFLVLKNKVDDFKNVVDTIGKEHGNSFFSVEITGPWPPFSFISIKEKF